MLVPSLSPAGVGRGRLGDRGQRLTSVLASVEGSVLGSPGGRDGGAGDRGEFRSGSMEVEVVSEGDLEGKMSSS